MKELTDGGYLELANEFEVAVGGEVFPHTHPTHEFYFVMTGDGGHDHRRRAARRRTRRPHLHPARHGAQPAPTRRRADPVLLLRGRRQGRRPHRLHEPVARVAGVIGSQPPARRLGYPTATLHEAQGQKGALPSAISALESSMRMEGRAITVSCSAGQNLRDPRGDLTWPVPVTCSSWRSAMAMSSATGARSSRSRARRRESSADS